MTSDKFPGKPYTDDTKASELGHRVPFGTGTTREEMAALREKDDGAPCAAAAGLIVFRGPVKRMFLCREHEHRYFGSGRVALYEGDGTEGVTARMTAEDETRPALPVYHGPRRTCGEDAEA